MSIRLNVIEKIEGPRGYCKMKPILDEFMKTNVKMVKLSYDEGEYKNGKSLGGSLYGAVRRENYPIKIRVVQNQVYLVRTDM